MGNSYVAWEGGAEFLAQLQAKQPQLNALLTQYSGAQGQQAAEGLAQYLTDSLERDPNALPPGLSETLDNWRAQGGGAVKAPKEVLKGVCNEFQNLFSKHSNITLTLAGFLGIAGSVAFTKHYNEGTAAPGADKFVPSAGDRLVTLASWIFGGMNILTMAAGPFAKKESDLEDSLTGKLAESLEVQLPEGMDPASAEGKMVKDSGSVFSNIYNKIIKHRETAIGSILTTGDAVLGAGLMSNAYLDRKAISARGEEANKDKRRTAIGAMVNTTINTMLCGLTYYNQYVEPKLKELDKSSPTYKEDRKKIWDEAPKEHVFKPARTLAKIVSKAPDPVRNKIPGMAIAAAFLPLSGMAKEGWSGDKENGAGSKLIASPKLFWGALAVMANVALSFTTISRESVGKKVMNAEETGQFTDMLAAAAQQQAGADSDKKSLVAELKDTIMGQTFVPKENEGLIEKHLHQAFGLPFTEVRDHSRHLPLSKDPVTLPSSHKLTKAVTALGADAADITPEAINLSFATVPVHTAKAVDSLIALGEGGESYLMKTMGGIQKQAAPDGKGGIVQLQPRALRPLAAVADKFSKTDGFDELSTEQVRAMAQECLQTAPPSLALTLPVEAPAQGKAR